MREQGKWRMASGPTGASLIPPQVISVLPWRHYCPACSLGQRGNSVWEDDKEKEEDKAWKNKAEI